MHRRGTDHTTTGNRLDDSVADHLGQRYNAVSGDSTEARVSHLIGKIRWQISRIAGATDADSGDRKGGARGNVFFRSSHIGVIELIGRRRGGGNDKAVGDGTLGAVRRTVVNYTLVAAFRLHHVGGRAASVKVEGVVGACLKHDLRELMHGSAVGERRLATVNDNVNQLAILCDADHCTGMTIRIVRAGGIGRHVNAIANQLGAEDVDSFLNTLAIVFRLEAVPVRLGIAHSCRAIVHNRKELAGIALLDLVVHDKTTTRLTGLHVVAVAVGRRYDLVVFADEFRVGGIGILLVGNSNHVRQLVQTVLIALHILVCDLRDHVVPAEIRDGHIIDHLLAVIQVSIVRILLNAGCEGLLRVSEHGVGLRGVVTICEGKCIQRKNTE